MEITNIVFILSFVNIIEIRQKLLSKKILLLLLLAII